MEWLLWLALGLVAGVLALLAVHRTLPREPLGWVGAVLIGLLGGLLGGWIMNLIGLEAVNWLGSLIIAFLGAVAILLILQRTGVRQA
jgi:uncharacterized membrane protein YeaQ/YmgE (transglycosylase-associated protein family)